MSAADPVWGKGQEFGGRSASDWIYRLRITLPDDPDTIASKRIDIAVSRRYEFNFVGSNVGDARIVLLNRQISQPSL